MNTSIIRIFFFLVFLVLIVLSVKYYIKYKYARDAISFALDNTLQCNKNNCDKPIKDFAKIPTQNGRIYNKDVARYCADLVSRIENGAITKKIINPKGLKLCKDLINVPNTPIFGKMWEQNISDKNILWVSFRGTINIKEWIQDLTYNQENFPKKKQIKLSFLGTQQHTPLIHKGFIDAYMNFRDDLFNVINSKKYDQIIVSGHSLGAAISTIVGIDLVNYGQKAVVYNFASPRLGDSNLCKMVLDVDIPIFRHVNTEDIIPTSPISVSPNFKDKYKPLMFIHCGEALYFTTNWKSVINNHLLGVYIDAFEKDIYKSLK
jgi:hypothetical protein